MSCNKRFSSEAWNSILIRFYFKEKWGKSKTKTILWKIKVFNYVFLFTSDERSSNHWHLLRKLNVASFKSLFVFPYVFSPLMTIYRFCSLTTRWYFRKREGPIQQERLRVGVGYPESMVGYWSYLGYNWKIC